MTAEALTALFVALGEAIAAIREALTRRRQDQASAALPSAEALEAHIRQLIAEALARATARPAMPSATESTGVHLEAGADQLKAHIDALVAEALERQRQSAPGNSTLGAESISSPPAAGVAAPGPAAAGAAEQVEHEPSGS